jgi:IS5 family transposase
MEVGRTRDERSTPLPHPHPPTRFAQSQDKETVPRTNGLIRRKVITDAATHDGARLREGLIQRANISRDVWADSAYQSAGNEAWLADHGMTSRIHRSNPRGR